LALDSTGATLSREMLAALDAFENVISQTPRTIDFLMRAGELLFSDNRRTIHARTPIPDSSASDRLMIRSWVRRGHDGT
jgi:alpha-ketoglutarate-dependent taurine dioxygenase